ncbi:MAG: hypothetical protein PHF37_07755 [Phycisphaerae bacterium]|nr:hypothetical protein [Phycisphaerae bacterium]
MTRRVKTILLAVLLAMLLMALLPPVNTQYSYYSEGAIKSRPVVGYDFLFAKSCKEINYSRLFLQYLSVLIAGTWFVLFGKKGIPSLARRVIKLSASNYNLQQDVTEGNHEAKQYKQKVGELKAAKENLGRQVNELKCAEQKWNICRDELERNVCELSKANERLEQQIAEQGQLKEAEKSFNDKLAIVKEKLEQQTRAREDVERQLFECNKQLDRILERQNINESVQEVESYERFERPKIKIEPLDVKKIKELAKLARRLS